MQYVSLNQKLVYLSTTWWMSQSVARWAHPWQLQVEWWSTWRWKMKPSFWDGLHSRGDVNFLGGFWGIKSYLHSWVSAYFQGRSLLVSGSVLVTSDLFFQQFNLFGFVEGWFLSTMNSSKTGWIYVFFPGIMKLPKREFWFLSNLYYLYTFFAEIRTTKDRLVM